MVTFNPVGHIPVPADGQRAREERELQERQRQKREQEERDRRALEEEARLDDVDWRVDVALSQSWHAIRNQERRTAEEKPEVSANSELEQTL